jgi:hypothetical protein
MAIKWYQHTWVIMLVIILFLPAGIVLVLLNNNWSIPTKILWIVVSSAIYYTLYYLTTLDGISTSLG